MTATSLLTVGRAFDGAVAMLRDTPTLDVGAHLALVGEDPPLLSAQARGRRKRNPTSGPRTSATRPDPNGSK